LLARYRKNYGLGWTVALALVVAAFLVLKMFTMNPYAGDEHIYVYQGLLVSQGETPYADFAMAHPPLQALTTGTLIKVFGYSFYLGRALPVFFATLCGLLVALAARREMGSAASVAAAAFCYFSYEPLRAASHFTGVNMAMAVIVGAYLAYRTGRIKLCAALCVAAVFTRLYTSPAVIALVVWALLSDWRRGLRLVAYGAAMGGAAVVIFGIWTGFSDMFDNMVAYHAQKTPMKPERLANMKDTVLFHSAMSVAWFTLSLPVIIRGMSQKFPRSGSGIMSRLKTSVRSSGTGLPLLGAFAALFLLFILLQMDRVWMYYFVPSFPFAAFAVGYTVQNLWGGATSLVRARGSLKRAEISTATVVGTTLLLFSLSLAYLQSPGLEEDLGYYQREMKKDPVDRVHSYQWQAGALPDWLEAPVKATLWQGYRTIGEPYNFYNYYLWHESRTFDVVYEIADLVRELTDDGDTIFGDSGSVPLVALLSGLPIAGNEVDTNIQRYRSGNADPKEMVRRIDLKSTKVIILRNRFGVAGVSQIKRLVKEKYDLVRTYTSDQNARFMVYRRKAAADGSG